MADDNDEMFYRGHRARLRQKFLTDKITDDELLELALAYAIPRRDVRPIARGLMQQFGDLFHIVTAPIEQLTKCRGIGENTAIFIKIIQKMTLIEYKERLHKESMYKNHQVLLSYLRNLFVGKQTEELHVVYFDLNFYMLADETHNTGTINYVDAYPREILKHALNLNAQYVILAHNHPLQDSMFSMDDIKLTERVINILQSANICLYDHYVVTKSGDLYSIKNEHLLE